MHRSGISRLAPFLLFSSISLFAAPLVQAVAQTPAIVARPAEGAQLAQDIASAGRLRMQSQRLAKLHVQAAMGLKAGQARQQIEATLPEVDAEFGRLSRHARKPNVQRTFARSEALWQEMRGLLQRAPDGAGSERLNLVADELMVHAGKLALLIEGEGETPVGRLVDLSSRLNMLSQRLARLYLQAYAGNHSQGVLTDIEQARKEFAQGLQELDTARENTSASRDNIHLARNQWIFFDNAIRDLNRADRREDRSAQNVATSSERIAQVLDQTSLQYVRDYSASIRNGR
ncbi:MAG: type IV pili methyl-accepting chemotaxis transducer N-terminal domain-containing protein [Azonexus sp.]